MIALSRLHALLLAASIGLTPSLAEACEPTTTRPEICWNLVGACAEGDVAGVLYVDWDPCYMDECISLWIYHESNGIPGLQRRDEVVDDTCGGQVAPDTLVF